MELNDFLEKAHAFRRDGDLAGGQKFAAMAFADWDQNDHLGLGIIYAYQAQLERDAANQQTALNLYRQALECFQKTDNAPRIAHTIRHIADLECELGLNEASLQHYEKALSYYDEHERTSLNRANALRGKALLLEAMHRPEDAVEPWSMAKDIYAQMDIAEGVDECNNHLTSLGFN